MALTSEWNNEKLAKQKDYGMLATVLLYDCDLFMLTTYQEKITGGPMAGWNFWKLMVALCTSGIRCHKKRWPLSVHHNFIVQMTQQKHLANGDNAIANFLCCSGSQVDPKHLINSRLLWQCKQGFCSSHMRGLASFWVLWSTCAMNDASNTNGGLLTTLLCFVTSGLQSQSHFNSMGMISIMHC